MRGNVGARAEIHELMQRFQIIFFKDLHGLTRPSAHAASSARIAYYNLSAHPEFADPPFKKKI